MDKLLIRGGRRLQGEVAISGAKNAALPELCAALLTAEPVTLRNVPRLQDVATMLKLIRNMGVSAERGDDGTVTIVAHRSEMGTGIRTSLPLVVADEMGADWSRVKIAQAPGDEPKYGNQDTDGSRSMRHFIQPMRQCGASMRQMLEAAAERLRLDKQVRQDDDQRPLADRLGQLMQHGDELRFPLRLNVL